MQRDAFLLREKSGYPLRNVDCAAGAPLNAHADVFHFHVVIHAVARSFAAQT
jgi:hypothetical protein